MDAAPGISSGVLLFLKRNYGTELRRGRVMPVIENIAEGIKSGRALYERYCGGNTDSGHSGHEDGSRGRSSQDGSFARNELRLGDNLEYMKELLGRGYAGSFRMIYIDPPFFTRSSFNASLSVRDSAGSGRKIHHLAYDDKFDRDLAYYIENMTARLLMMRDLLADDGLMWIHLDWHSAHYIKLVLDELMGEKSFVNEIIWCYKSGGSGKKHFARKHDTILVYSKTDDYYINVPKEKSYNRDRKPYRFRGVSEYKDENGWYTMVNMKDVWSIDMVGRTSAERTGYATQKPLELMRRIIEASTEEGDLVGDFFCGSGSLMEAAHLTGRAWSGCDSEELAAAMTRRRLAKAGASFLFTRQDEARPLSGRADVQITGMDELEDGRFIYRCRLTDFVPDIDTGSIQMKDRKHIDDALRADRLQFADHIMIYPGDESGAVGGSMVFCDEPEEMSFIAGPDFTAVVVDIFGKEYEAGITADF